MTNNQIIDFCLDNKNLTEKELNLQLKNILSKETIVPYDHTKDSLLEACGLDSEKSLKSAAKMFSEVGEKYTSASEFVEQLEETFSKRELSYLFYNAIRSYMALKEAYTVIKNI